MAHELRGLEHMPHDYFSAVLVAAGVVIVVFAAFVWYVNWKHRKPRSDRHAEPPAARRRVRKRKRRS